LTSLSRALDRSATLDDIPDGDLDRLAEMGFDWIWFQSVWRLKRISPHLGRGPDEPGNPTVEHFYERLLDLLQRPVVRHGQWQLVECVPAFDGDGSCDNFIACTWQESGGERLLVTVNYSAHFSRCYVRLSFPDLDSGRWQLQDMLGDARYERDGDDLQSKGLYLNVAPWHYHAFQMILT
jgi:hypothetical protein